MSSFQFNNKQKIDCPYCQSKKCFSPIIGYEEHQKFGICDKKNKCTAANGIFPDKEIPSTPIEIKPKIDLKAIYLDEKEIEAIRSNHTSTFHTYCKAIGISAEHLLAWNVGTDAHGNTVFIFQNQKGKWCNRKAGSYAPNGKREKGKMYDFLSMSQPHEDKKNPRPEKYLLPLFGEQFLTDENKETPVMIVESEKSAVIASFFYPDYIWVACGSASGLSDGSNGTNDKITPLMGRFCYWLSDADPAGRKNSSLDKLDKYGIRHKLIDLFPKIGVEKDDPKKGFDIADAISEGKRPDLARAINAAPERKKTEFWYLGSNKEIKVHQMRLTLFFEEQGYRSFKKQDGEIQVVHIKDKILDDVDTYFAKQETMNFIKNCLPEKIIEKEIQKKEDTETVVKTKLDLLDALIRGENVYFAKSKFDWLPPFTGHIETDTNDASYFFFKNGFVEVSRGKKVSATFSEYKDLQNYIWRTDIKDFEFDLLETDKIECDYQKFLWNVSGQKPQDYGVLLSSIGYLLHRFKNPSYPVALILGDEGINMQEKGGRGKGLIMQAISQLRNVITIDGKKVDMNYAHLYDRVNANTNIVFFDDVHPRFDFKRLFNDLTGPVQVTPKGKTTFSLPFEHAPKFALTTNYVVESDDESSNRRKLEVEIAAHYSSKHRPLDEFKRNFFSQWDAQEWNRFYNIMIRCSAEYFNSYENGKPVITPNNTNLQLKKLLQYTSKNADGFVDFCEEYIHEGIEYDKKPLMEQFINIYPDAKETLKQRTFTEYLRAWGKYKNYEINERPSSGQLLIKFFKK